MDDRALAAATTEFVRKGRCLGLNVDDLNFKQTDDLMRAAIEAYEREKEPPLTATQLADALGCFWNAAIGSANDRQDATAFSVVGAMAEGIAAIQKRLTEQATEA
jgi:hypothetical protein